MSSRSPGIFETCVSIAARIPFWAVLALALIAFIGFDFLARIDVPTTSRVADAGPMIVWQMAKTLGSILRFLIPAALLLGALAAWLRKRKRGSILANVKASTRDIGNLSWRDFERLVGAYFDQRGYHVVETGGSADGGVDLELTKDGERYLVQCKHWRARSVGVEPVRELYGVLAARRCTGAFVVTSGTFTKAARDFAQGREIELIDGDALQKVIAIAPTPMPTPAPAQSPPIQPSASPAQSPTCPRCAAPMIQRTAKSGPRAGQPFWGCTAYPACRGTRAA